MTRMKKKKGREKNNRLSMSSENDRCYSWTRTIPDTLNKKKNGNEQIDRKRIVMVTDLICSEGILHLLQLKNVRKGNSSLPISRDRCANLLFRYAMLSN